MKILKYSDLKCYVIYDYKIPLTFIFLFVLKKLIRNFLGILEFFTTGYMHFQL